MRPPPHGLEKDLHNPGQPRANKAVSREKPDGSEMSAPHRSVLQQHVDFFDRDLDGIIWPWDTYVGFRRIGFGVVVSSAAMIVIHTTFGYPSQDSWIPNPLFPIHTKNMHRTKHGSDSEVFDTEGRFVPQKFEEIFSKYDSGNKGALSWDDIQHMVRGNMNVNDPIGWTAERLEWWVLWWLAKDERGLLSKERIRANYDGTLWELLAAKREGRTPFVYPEGHRYRPHAHKPKHY
jgi:peroxygenase